MVVEELTGAIGSTANFIADNLDLTSEGALNALGSVSGNLIGAIDYAGRVGNILSNRMYNRPIETTGTLLTLANKAKRLFSRKGGKRGTLKSRSIGTYRPRRRSRVNRSHSRFYEQKLSDTRVHAISITKDMSTNDNMYIINLVPPGTGSYQRIGRKVLCNTLHIRGNITWNWPDSSNSFEANQMRVLVVHDKQPNSSTIPLRSQILADKNSTDGSPISEFESAQNIDNSSRFDILFDRTLSMDPANHVASRRCSAMQRVDLVLRNLDILTSYSSDSTPPTASDVATGSIYLMFIKDKDFNSVINVSYAEPEIDIHVRMAYED